jgi:hypothetical protein
MKSAALLLAAFCLTTLTASAAVPSADQVLKEAKEKATAEQKVIFVYFTASWSGWCTNLDAFLERDDVKSVFEKYFVRVKLVALETAEYKAQENPGANALLRKLGGPDGLPYSAFLNAQGALIVNSKRPSKSGGRTANIGYPVHFEEVEWFIEMLRKAAPTMPEDDLKTIRAALKNPKK